MADTGTPLGTSTARGGAEIPFERTARLEHTGFRLSWGAVIAGLVVATAIQVVLAVLGGAIGLAAFDTDSGKGLGIGAAIWALATILLSLYFGGTTTGRLAGVLSRKDGMLHGLLLWAVSTLLTVWMISRGLGAITGAAFGAVQSVVGTTVGAVAQGAVAAGGAAVANERTDGDDLSLRAELETLLRQTGVPALQPDSLRADANRAQQTVTQGPQDNGAAASEIAALFRDRAGSVDREAVINVIVARTGRSRAEAEQLADRAIQLRQTASRQLDTLQAKAGDVAEDVASATSTGLWLALLGLGLSLAAAVAGARSTARE